MGFFEILFTGVALSMDACAVGMTNGMCNTKMPLKRVLLISLFFGFGIIVAGEKAEPFAKFVDSVNEVSMKVMDMIIKLSPIGVFCLITPVVAENGPKILGSLAMVLLTAYICYAVHTAVVYSATVKFIGKTSPLRFFKEMAPAMAFAFSSASSTVQERVLI
mgnify:CR=1 FL=1